jgi:hypothetical protein
MLYWGNFRQAYRDLRSQQHDDITGLFRRRSIDAGRLASRGKIATPALISKDARYLISEMASETYQKAVDPESAAHVAIARRAFRELRKEALTVDPALLKERAKSIAEGSGQLQLVDLLYEDSAGGLSTEEEVIALYSRQWHAFQLARAQALDNTKIYLSACNDLDVYVATSMRTRDDFRHMADVCEQIFAHSLLKGDYNIRYFDPTLSAADHHEDKGIIECLMVKTCKVLLYFAQYRESLGKVSEYAMALSLGKPVIILCPDDARGRELYGFYRDKHPLTRLIEFNTGIVNGAIITTSAKQVQEVLCRLMSNQMEYDLDVKPGTDAYYLLKERLTGSTVRVVSDNKLLTETFWNNYHEIQ